MYLSKEQTSDMTAAKRFNAFLSLLPLVNIHKRPYILLHIDKQDGNGPIAHKVPLATFDDLKYAMYIMQFSNGVRPYVLQWFYEVFHACYKIHDKPAYKNKIVGKYKQRIEESRIGVTVDELIAETKSKKGKAYTSKQLHEGFIYPLMNQGYIDSVGSEIDHRKNIYFPTSNITLTDENQSENIVFSTKSDERQNTYEDCKVNLRDSTILPNKQYIMSKIRGVLESSSESHIDVTFYDQEGNDIQIETLVDRYYQNPENYFGYPPVDIFNDIQNRPSDDNLKKGQNGDVSQGNNEEAVKPIESEVQDSNKIVVSEEKVKRQYSEYLVDGVPIWERESRGMNQEEAEAFKTECERLGKEKGAK